MTTEVTGQQFKLYVPFTTKSQNTEYSENSDGTLTIEGIASTTNKDLQGDIILPSAINSMKQQLLTTTKNLHGDHDYGLDGIYGAIKEVLDSDDTCLKIRADILKSKSSQIKEMLDVGVNLGLSIGGKITEYTILEDHGWEIKDLSLMEISLTGMPANWDTFGTIQESKTGKSIVKAKCLAGACHVIRKNNGEIMTQNEDLRKAEGEDVLTKEDVVDLFNELMASQKEEIIKEVATETVKQVTTELQSIVQAEIDKLKEEPSKDDEGESVDEEEESMKAECAPEEEDEEKEKAFADLISKTVKDAVDANISSLFKDLEQSRAPQFKVDDVDKTGLNKNEPVETSKGMTSREIAEKMFQGQSQENMIRSLLGN